MTLCSWEEYDNDWNYYGKILGTLCSFKLPTVGTEAVKLGSLKPDRRGRAGQPAEVLEMEAEDRRQRRTARLRQAPNFLRAKHGIHSERKECLRNSIRS